MKLNSFERYTIELQSDAFHCLEKMEINGVKSVIVMQGDLVVGTVSDGDIRKLLLNQRQLTMPIRHVMNQDYHFGKTESECMEILARYPYIFIVPLIDETRRLINIYSR